MDKCAGSRWVLNPQTGLVDINGVFDCSEQGLTDFKGVRFGKVRGDFNCYKNELTTLVGAPQSVGGSFWCGGNQLTTLEGAPQSVREFDCQRNQLTSLVGAPQSVSGYFNCSDNELTTLEGAPQTVGGPFICRDNALTSLVGAPQTVKGGFNCRNNPVSETTLASILALMEKGKSYQQALEERWPKMKDVDRAVLYKQMPDLSPEDVRKYKALAIYNNIKGYL